MLKPDISKRQQRRKCENERFSNISLLQFTFMTQQGGIRWSYTQSTSRFVVIVASEIVALQKQTWWWFSAKFSHPLQNLPLAFITFWLHWLNLSKCLKSDQCSLKMTTKQILILVFFFFYYSGTSNQVDCPSSIRHFVIYIYISPHTLCDCNVKGYIHYLVIYVNRWTLK